MLLHFDATLIVIAISFIIFAVIMHHVFYVPMRRIMGERDEFITAHINEARSLNENAENIIKEYRSKLQKARLTARGQIEELSQEGKKEKSTILVEAKNQADSQIKNAKNQIEEEKFKALDSLKADVAPLAQNIVSKILGTTVSISGIDQDKIDKLLRG
jgi:F-type H+-transporting ATPase subunit b